MAVAEALPPLFAPEFFDSATGGTEPPADALHGFALDLDAAARRASGWVIETAGNQPLRLVPLRRANEGASIGFECLGVTGTLRLSAGPSGWLRVSATIGTDVVFTAFAERLYEEYELHPPASRRRASGAEEDAPGRLGKRRDWLSLSAQAWPRLAPLANAEGWVLLRRAGE